jgi:SWI/SNF-related matrix-associated actin-dependent regulator of chromatin subfamily A-like protein 1
MNLLPHQEVSKQFLLNKGRCILADEPRVGKTLATASAALQHLPALIVCPAIVKTVWQSAFTNLDPSIPVTIINGKKNATSIGADGITIINYDLLGSIQEMGNFKTLVLDESHRIKSPKAVRTVAAQKLMSKIKYVYALSGTPIPNRPIELWPLLNGLGIYRGGYYDFAARYARMWKAPWGLDVSGASNLPELKEMMKPFVLRRKKADVFTEYQEPIVSLITFDLPVDHREKDFDIDALIDHPNPMLAFDGLSEVMKEAGLRKVKPAIEFILDKLETGEPIVVFAHHKEVVHAIKDEIKKHCGVSVITGETNQKYRADIIQQFQSGQNKVFIGNLAACQEGIDLSAADTVVFVEATWQTSALLQASSRIENINKASCAPLIYLLTIARSLDHTILKKVLLKQNIVNQII